MAFTNQWDVNFPADTQLANLIGSNLRQLRLDIQQRMSAISGNSNAGTTFPAFISDTQPGNWNGILFFDTVSGKIYQFNGAQWTDISASFGSGSRFISISGNTNNVDIPAGTNLYFGLDGQFSVSQGLVYCIMPVSGTFSSVTVYAREAPMNFGLVQNSNLVAEFSVNAPGTVTTAISVPFVIGDLFYIIVANTGSSPIIAPSIGLVY